MTMTLARIFEWKSEIEGSLLFADAKESVRLYDMLEVLQLAAMAISERANAARAERYMRTEEARADGAEAMCAELRLSLDSALAAHKHDSGDEFCWCLKSWRTVGRTSTNAGKAR